MLVELVFRTNVCRLQVYKYNTIICSIDNDLLDKISRIPVEYQLLDFWVHASQKA